MHTYHTTIDKNLKAPNYIVKREVFSYKKISHGPISLETPKQKTMTQTASAALEKKVKRAVHSPISVNILEAFFYLE